MEGDSDIKAGKCYRSMTEKMYMPGVCLSESGRDDRSSKDWIREKAIHMAAVSEIMWILKGRIMERNVEDEETLAKISGEAGGQMKAYVDEMGI